jgi:hypothetical protein
MVRRLRTFPQCACGYDFVVTFKLEGPVAVEDLRGALADLAQRHSVLRTTVDASGPEDVQRVQDAGAVEPRRASIVGQSLDEAVAGLLDARHETDAVLAGSALFRPQILELEPERHLLVLTIHHLLYDGLSFPVLWRDLSELYLARRQRRAPVLPLLRTSYLQYAERQRESWPTIGPRAVAFWEAMTAGAPHDLPWRAAQPSHPQPFEVAFVTVELQPSAVHRLRAMARAARVTPFLTLLAATGVALGRATRQDDVLLGTDFAHREDPFKHDMVGHLLNTRLTRVRDAAKRSLRDQLDAVRETWLCAEEHRDAYLDQVLGELGGPRLTSVLLEPVDVLGGPELADVAVTPVALEPVDLNDRDHRYLYWRELMVTWRSTATGYTADIMYRPAAVGERAPESLARELRAVV